MQKLLRSNALSLSIYGLGAAVVLILLEVGRDYFLFTLNRIDIWISSIALVFVAAGILIGHSVLKWPKSVSTDPGWSFSRRETEVLQYLLTNLSNKEICEKLFIENSTLKTHVNRIYKKTGARNRRELQLQITALGLNIA